MFAVPVPLVIDQLPPEVASVNATVEAPIQTEAVPPAKGATVGNAFMVSDEVAELVHVPLLTV